MKPRLRIRLLVAFAAALAILAVVATYLDIRAFSRNAETARRDLNISSAQLVKLYIEAGVPGEWKKQGGNLYKGQERLVDGRSIRSALGDYLPPDATIVFGVGDRPEEVAPAPGFTPGKPDTPYITASGACVPVLGTGGEEAGWISIMSGEEQRGLRRDRFLASVILALTALYLLAISAFGTLALRLAKPFDTARDLDGTSDPKQADISNKDPLTGLLNRRGIEEALSKTNSAPTQVAIIDVDSFKSINDERGQGEGDRVLASLAGIIAANIRNQDFCGRWGGAEFVVVYCGLASAYVESSAERIRAAVEAHGFGSEDAPLRVTVTMGVASMGEGGFLKAVSVADEAMYSGKREGRNRIVIAG
jgi:diguanylate cyclase (GGDEF)-like protein